MLANFVPINGVDLKMQAGINDTRQGEAVLLHSSRSCLCEQHVTSVSPGSWKERRTESYDGLRYTLNYTFATVGKEDAITSFASRQGREELLVRNQK